MKIVWSLLFVAALILLGLSPVGFQRVQLWVLYATLPVTVAFIVGYWPERPWRNWFGASLMNLALAILALELAASLSRLLLGSAPYAAPLWLSLLATTWIGLMFVAMFQRTAVLLFDQAWDRRGLGWFFARHSSRIYHTIVGR
jgi:hypothetical protein